MNHHKYFIALEHFFNSYQYTHLQKYKRETSLWNLSKRRFLGTITIEATVVCTISVLFLGTVLLFFGGMKKEFDLKQSMYRVTEQLLYLELGADAPKDYDGYERMKYWMMREEMLLSNRLRMYGFEGYKPGMLEQEIYVYVTRYGSVYHSSLDCEHINIKILAVPAKEIATLRNASGGIYYPCMFCGADEVDGICYVTPEGKAYHRTRDCFSLLRYVEKISISEIGDREACKDCWE